MSPRPRAVRSICPTTDCPGEVMKADRIWGKEHYDNMVAMLRRLTGNEHVLCFTCTKCKTLVVTDLANLKERTEING